MKIYIIRHGETEENVKKTYYGSIDCNLTEKGKTQAKALGNKLKDIEFDKIFCSERIRAKETLRDIYLANDVIIDSRINERDFGIFEGRTFSELQIELKEEYDKWAVDWKDYCPENGESFRDVYVRVRSFMEDMKKEEAENKNILVCTHGGIIRAIYAYILDENLDTYWRFASKNADISVLNLEYGYFYIDSIIPVD
ncbi:MAG: alpha-ribazole phosphatase [Clostridium sp.]|uniref:alpha-ribazole phosphatase n=1 Tax=Clostridium sp. TaxID=1506 RepID=UPI0030598F6C